MQESPQNAAHEHQRNEYRDQGQRHGDNREANFTRAHKGGFTHGHTRFNMADNIFQHHNRIIDDKPHREGQGQQGQVIHRVTKNIHHDERAQERHRNG